MSMCIHRKFVTQLLSPPRLGDGPRNFYILVLILMYASTATEYSMLFFVWVEHMEPVPDYPNAKRRARSCSHPEMYMRTFGDDVTHPTSTN